MSDFNCNRPYTCEVCHETIPRTDNRIRRGELDNRPDNPQFPLHDLIFVCGSCVDQGYHLENGQVQLNS